jgi:cystathionine beta-lyase family protein involved in aluminum resistance
MKAANANLDVRATVAKAEESLADSFRAMDETAVVNHRRVLQSLQKHKLTEELFAEHTGYGHDDAGRDAMDAMFADALQAESALVRMHFVSGTHAIACALFGNLMHGERMVALTGKPYDTMLKVIGIPESEPGTIRGHGVIYEQCDSDLINLSGDELSAAVARHVKAPCKVAYIQKSRGYSSERRTLSNAEIGHLASAVKKANPDCLVIVDNCYGEFVEASEPTAHGADLIAGSLIKNPGGGLAICGGYVAGKENAVEGAVNRLTAPGIGSHLGLTFNQNRLIFQGLFMAPNVVAGAVKGAMLAAKTLHDLGVQVYPAPEEPRYDIIQAIHFGSDTKLVNFCRALQRCSPVNAHVTPEPSPMPGYPDPVIMAGGSFIEGATIELSADGPLRAPYTGFWQGGLSYLHVKCVLEDLLELSLSGVFPFL